MRYQYDPTDNDQAFAENLSKALELPIGWFPGNTPYIEANFLYPGVIIRRITNLDEKTREDLTKRADQIHKEMFGKPNNNG